MGHGVSYLVSKWIIIGIYGVTSPVANQESLIPWPIEVQCGAPKIAKLAQITLISLGLMMVDMLN